MTVKEDEGMAEWAESTRSVACDASGTHFASGLDGSIYVGGECMFWAYIRAWLAFNCPSASSNPSPDIVSVPNSP